MNIAQQISIDPTVAKYLSMPRKLLIDGTASPAAPSSTAFWVAAAPWILNVILFPLPLSKGLRSSSSAGLIFPVLIIVISAPEAGFTTAIPAIAATALTMSFRERFIVALPKSLVQFSDARCASHQCVRAVNQ
jgi:hypothetical protein